jgi:outer membrane protein OmpA-like peptidoglycan-associated protein
MSGKLFQITHQNEEVHAVFKRISIIVLSVWVVLGCAASSTGGLTRKDIIVQYDAIRQLSTELTVAEGNGAPFLAPQGFAQAQEQLELAIKYGSAGKKEKAEATAEEGLGTLKKVRRRMEESREMFSEVLATRERARNTGAPGLFPNKYQQLEEDLHQATQLLEDGKEEKAVKLRKELLEAYSELELKALKKGTVAAAKAAIKQAEKNEAGDYAPKTLKQAKEELKRVALVLDADRTQTGKANEHALRVIWIAGRAEAITKLAKMFEDKDYPLESIVLWYQAQLDEISEPLKRDLPFNEPNAVVVDNLKQVLASLMNAMADARKMMKENQSRIADLEQKTSDLHKEYQGKISELLGASRKELVVLRKKYANELSPKARQTAEEERIDVENKERFEYVQSMFTSKEAKVSRDKTDVLIQVHGFRFPPGKAQINAVNFGLLNKVISAIEQYPKSQVIISGHTDSKGNADRNLALSVKRAANVQKFLHEIGGISTDRTESQGFGEKKPVVSNNKKRGRALNRRIEVLIVIR